MKPMLPEAFINRMRIQLGSELAAFLDALEEPPVRGIRINPMKITGAAEQYTGAEQVPWDGNAYYLDNESNAGISILHEAGAYYIQEPAAMLPAVVLDAKPGERILDLCAAPGGKSTQIGCAMRGEGLLVCNEPVPKRAQILNRNIERTGLPNTVVTIALPEQLAERWGNGFDAVLVDAPCSGEGMFRRDPSTRCEWSASKAQGCVLRQREILLSAAKLVRNGGRLVYSTCTYNPDENEKNAAWFVSACPEFHAESFYVAGIDAPTGMYTCYPHRIKGEGQFVALFKKDGDEPAELPPNHSLPAPHASDAAMFENSFPGLPHATHLIGDTLICMHNLPDTEGIRILRAGLHLGEIRGKTAIPDHAAAMSFQVPDVKSLDLTADQAIQYMSGETVSGDAAGWVLMCCAGLVLGWGKGSGGVIKNHYPKGLRKNHLLFV